MLFWDAQSESLWVEDVLHEERELKVRDLVGSMRDDRVERGEGLMGELKGWKNLGGAMTGVVLCCEPF